MVVRAVAHQTLFTTRRRGHAWRNARTAQPNAKTPIASRRARPAMFLSRLAACASFPARLGRPNVAALAARLAKSAPFPRALAPHMKCCPTRPGGGVGRLVGGACAGFCKGELKSKGLMCCKGGGLFGADGSLDTGGQYAGGKTAVCCGGEACYKRTSWCIKRRGVRTARCVPKLFH
jgi:hypothetical protein